ncbi:MAG: ACT domain-containing protein [Clostridia bacterium]|nr:ACT domain-containing protein [Clostridia bacterium]
MSEKQHGRFLLVDAAALPDVFERVIEAKRLLQTGEALSASDAARRAGISRSAFYKYKDAVFPYDEGARRILTVHFVLSDHPGVLSSVLAAFAAAGANVLTVNQNIPADGTATVSISARTERMTLSTERFLRQLTSLSGVRRLSHIAGNDGLEKKE